MLVTPNGFWFLDDSYMLMGSRIYQIRKEGRKELMEGEEVDCKVFDSDVGF